MECTNSNSLTFIGDNNLFRIYYLQKTSEYFGYFISDIGLLPIKIKNATDTANYVYNNIHGNIECKIKFSTKSYNNKKIKKLLNTECNITYSNILNVIRLIS